ncbi:MAG: hypothetical protein EPN76_07855 [Burkholderiaceae bacterium]|nr:MAG: hypothetical protein EPN76_07855 [Burkholderiaceae bacterium]TAM03788.1 MAG: hypothetical protein EPN67_09130 [Pusillimonas sp.]
MMLPPKRGVPGLREAPGMVAGRIPMASCVLRRLESGARVGAGRGRTRGTFHGASFVMPLTRGVESARLEFNS